MSVASGWKRNFSVIAVFVLVWLGFRYLFPLFLPFLLGLVLALASEPCVKFLQRRLGWQRGPAAFVSVTLTLAALLGLLGLGVTVLVRRTASMARSFSGAAEQVTAGLHTLRSWAVDLAGRAPAGLAEPLTRSVEGVFTDGGGLPERLTGAALDLAGRIAQDLPGFLVTLGTALLAAYMLSARLAALRDRVTALPAWQDRWRPALRRLRDAAGQWLRAQVRLSGVTFCIVLGGFFLLGVRSKLPMALLTALVDAVPLLGTGTVLLPWALVSLLGGEPVRAVGLLGVYATAVLIRSSLEPKLVGRQLGLDPLASLAALYAGWRIWGFWGMVLAPILTVTVKELCRSGG